MTYLVSASFLFRSLVFLSLHANKPSALDLPIYIQHKTQYIRRASNMASKDPYTSKASGDASLDQKVSEVDTIIKASKFAMLTTKGTDGLLHSRAMSPASTDGLVFQFIANVESGKFDELENDPAVNVSFSDASNTHWVSAAGKANIVKDTEHIKTVWSPAIKAWFGDLGDGKHTGNYDDPRVAVIAVEPSEIRYWYAQQSKVGQALSVAKGAITGETAAPGALRKITSSEIQQVKSKA